MSLPNERHCTERAPRASVTTLGCRLNQADSALMTDALVRAGYRVVDWGEPADLLVVNSCVVTKAAEVKTRRALRGARHRCPDSRVMVVGCGVDAASEPWTQDDLADLALGNGEKQNICLHARALFDVTGSGTLAEEGATDQPDDRDHTVSTVFRIAGCGRYPGRTRANLKIQEGCDFFCSYCIVPFARGTPRSREREDVRREARELIERGHRELVLTGVNIGCYSDGNWNLPDLVHELLNLPGQFRLRLSSLEPGAGVPDIVQMMKTTDRLCHFLHMPLQYGDDRLLAAMNRRYTVDEFAEFANAAKADVPDLCLGTDVIVGFPGETAEIFESCRETVDRLPMDYLHVFNYSPRPGTAAAGLPRRVHGRDAAERSAALRHIGQQKERAFAESNVGRTVTVLTETCDAQGRVSGWSDNYLRVHLDVTPPPRVNEFVSARITGVGDGRTVNAQLDSGV